MVGIAAKMIPFGELAWRINMVSAVFGAVAVANLFLLLRLWLDKIWPALVGAVTLAISWTFWQNAVIAEAYTLYATQLFTELLVLFLYVRKKNVKYLYLLGLLNGLSIANHLWGIFPLACYGIYLLLLIYRKDIRLKVLLLFVVLWIVGASPYLYLIIKDCIQSGDLAGTIQSALFGQGWQSRVLNASVSLKIVLENIIFILLNFPTPNIILIFAGVCVLWSKAPSRGFANIIFVLLLLYFIFAFRYTVADRHAFFLPFYCIAALLIGLGTDWFLIKFKNKPKFAMVLLFFCLLPVGSYFFTPEIARKHYPSLSERRQRPYRDEYTYWLQPWKNGYDGAKRFAVEALEGVPEGTVIYAYTTDVHTMLYVQEVEGIRQDVKIISDHDSSRGAPALDENTFVKLLSEGPLYVTSDKRGYFPHFLNNGYEFIKQGLLYRVVKSDTDS
jgi:hypothetical protein